MRERNIVYKKQTSRYDPIIASVVSTKGPNGAEWVSVGRLLGTPRAGRERHQTIAIQLYEAPESPMS